MATLLDTPTVSRTHVVIRRIAMATATAVIVVALAGTAVFLLRGGRLFIIQTPSMGLAAPIGSLVATSPVAWGHLHVGDVISFHPPTDLAQTYTHRIVSISARGIQTRGDLNGATDGWLLHPGNVIGRADVILPGGGWILEMTPWLLAGASLVWWVSRFIDSREWRAAAQHVGVVSVLALVVRHFQPLFRIIVLNFGATAHGDRARVVSEGLLPTAVNASGGAHLVLHYGQSAVVPVVPDHITQRFTLAEHVYLDIPTVIAVIVISFGSFYLHHLLLGPSPVLSEGADS